MLNLAPEQARRIPEDLAAAAGGGPAPSRRREAAAAAGLAAPRIAVLIPCYNEEVAIPGVVRAFRAALPAAAICVYDNNSRDRTRSAAAEAGAVVRTEPLQGKGNVVRRMFADIEADAYLLVDGDGTYDAAAAPEMVRMLVEQRLDMVTGVRVTPEEAAAAAYRPGHRLGNAMLTGMVRLVFGDRISDMLSGYRVFSRRFVKSFPALAEGFETETEFTVHALQLKMPVGEVRTAYGERPLAFFSAAAGVLLLLALALFVPVLVEYLRTGLVPRLPTAVLSTGLALASLMSFACGLILDTVTRGRKEAKRIAYLSIPAPDFDARGPGDPPP
jgi:glycosyltransferase involved in cell wall biosynthesis